MTDKEYCLKYNIKCKCGEQAVVFDSWFNYYPCIYHKHLTPNEYSKRGKISMMNDIRQLKYPESGLFD